MASLESSIGARPGFSWAELEPLAARFGTFVLVRSLPSERDQNLLLRESSSGGDDEAISVVLKVHNPNDHPEFVDCQNRALEAAAAAGASCQRPLRTLDSGDLTVGLPSGPGADAGTCHCRVLSFLPGRVLAEVAAAGASDRDALWAAVGRAVGGLTAALLQFDHPAAHRDFVWDLRCCEDVVSARLGDVREERRPILEQLLGQFRKEMAPRLQGLRLSVVHNDPNDYNLVVDDEGRVGILDFGDMVHSYTCADAAICAAYLLLHCPEGCPLVQSIVPFVSSFHEQCPLTAAEADTLFGLAVMRVCTSVCMSAYQSKLEPDNEYLLISAKPGWRLLERLATEPTDEIPSQILRNVCGFGPE